MPIFLGFDCSTQSLSAVLLRTEGRLREIVFQHSLEFDGTLPHYRTRNGVCRGPGPLEVTSPPLMWSEALERMIDTIAKTPGINLSEIAAVSGSAQQHGTVYLARGSERVLRALDPTISLVRQIRGIFSRDESPVWMDESTRAQCDEIDAALGGPAATARLTGSAATERFAGPQIRKFCEQAPAAYAETEQIHLVSSYLASLLVGVHAPVDRGDGAGMNLLDIESFEWSGAALDATAPALQSKLPLVCPPHATIGRLAPYWQQRFGLPAARVVAWTGDNPGSLVGMGMIGEGTLGVSLGTSDTVFACSPTLAGARAATHVFGSPMGGYMGLVCFRNGSLAREAVRRRHGTDWGGFSRALRETPPGNGGAMMLPWFEPEITPRVTRAGVRTHGLRPDDAPASIRAVVEGQVLSMAIHAEALAGARCSRVIVTGGASDNAEIRRVIADAFDAEVFRAAETNAACLGAALRAFHAHETAEGRSITWEEVVIGITEPPDDSVVAPVRANVELYRAFRERYRSFQTEALETAE